ncbi:sporulation YhaL family protein [Sporolactobacillus laevolacticus]|uniref:Signal peptidase n=1 Tax=Sporolactobacillus laevolacticus DSM 442 TaxID=1395513 RepID=V6J166_9BACL|nr:sporulation YhaL family protein [Sporolactobacillus laevolacticus]EST10504.1 signal peptidase [Sporolactobacillus laevolacticus DSM 442]MDN3955736.1 sporulation YhaL family protein [Sporolactobacillus laevolacticus]
MKQARRSLIVVALLFLLFMLQQFGLIDPVINKLESIAWWVYLVVAGIIFSGYQAFSISRQDKEVDEEWVEQQGNVYMKRMDAEKKRRQSRKNPKAMQ